MTTLDDDPVAALLAWIRPAFHADAACREHPELSWFPERGEKVSAQQAICAGCLVQSECAAAGEFEHFGMWGGLSNRQRKAQRREQRGAAGAHSGPRRSTAERLRVIGELRAIGASSEVIAHRLGISLVALNHLERRYLRPAA